MQVRLAMPDDFAPWDRYVTAHPEATPYHLVEWAIACERAYGHRHVCLLAEEGGRLAGVMPLSEVAVPFGARALLGLPFCDVGGCLADDADLRERLVDHALEICRERRASRIELRTRETGRSAAAPEAGDKVCMILALPASADELFDSFKAKLRSQVRKASKNGLEFHAGRSRADLERFYAVFSRNMRDIGSPVHSFAWFEAIRSLYGENILVAVVSLGDKPVGAGILLRAGARVAVPWASTLREYNRLAPNMLLYWKLLEYATKAGCGEFDFGRSTYNEGTYRFKRQWGAAPVALSWTSMTVDGDMQKSALTSGTARKLAESAWRRLPVPIATFAGPRIRKYITL
jgi:FemAB-related protein (PEP-CTERM system-associated)